LETYTYRADEERWTSAARDSVDGDGTVDIVSHDLQPPISPSYAHSASVLSSFVHHEQVDAVGVDRHVAGAGSGRRHRLERHPAGPRRRVEAIHQESVGAEVGDDQEPVVRSEDRRMSMGTRLPVGTADPPLSAE
jgi:hypothetical protein